MFPYYIVRFKHYKSEALGREILRFPYYIVRFKRFSLLGDVHFFDIVSILHSTI